MYIILEFLLKVNKNSCLYDKENLYFCNLEDNKYDRVNNFVDLK